MYKRVWYNELEVIMEKSNKFDLLALGEIMLRLSSPNNERITRGDMFQKGAGGSELNIVSGVSLLGLRTGVITKLPNNQLGTYIKNRIRFFSVSDDYIVYDDSDEARLGVYYYENGAHPRKPAVVYDRKFASINTLKIDELPESMYSSAKIFHTSGITLALCNDMRELVIEVIKKFKEKGTKISFDVNFRANLWTEAEAKETIQQILPYVDILFISEETFRRMFQMTGTVEEMQKQLSNEYNIEVVATTERKIISPRKHDFTSTIYSSVENKWYKEAPYLNIEVVDRIGSGDAYVSGVLFGLLKYNDVQKALEFGNACCSVKNTIPGDLPASEFDEIARIIKSHNNSGYESEMSR